VLSRKKIWKKTGPSYMSAASLARENSRPARRLAASGRPNQKGRTPEASGPCSFDRLRRPKPIALFPLAIATPLL